VVLKNVKTEKYGRLLAEVWFEGQNMNEWLVEQRFAVAYDGGTKRLPKSWRRYYEKGVLK